MNINQMSQIPFRSLCVYVQRCFLRLTLSGSVTEKSKQGLMEVFSEL